VDEDRLEHGEVDRRAPGIVVRALVTPVGPTVHQALCYGGVVHPPTLEIEQTDSIAYDIPPGPYEPGDDVLVTATLTEGAWTPAMPEGWRLVDAVTATYTIAFEDVRCTETTPVLPEVVPAVCAAGTIMPPALTFPGATVGYVLAHSPIDLGDGLTPVEVTIIATVKAGFSWPSPPPDG
jgi:hypothetical protein